MSETESIVRTVKTTLQDIIAPYVRQLKVQVAGLQEQLKSEIGGLRDEIKIRFDAMQYQFDSAQSRSDAHFQALLAAIH